MASLLLYFDDFTLADLSGANLQKSAFHYTSVDEAKFIDADLRDAWFWFSNARRANFSDAILDGANFDQTDLTSAKFVGASLRNVIFNAAVIDGVDFTDADLTGASFSRDASEDGFSSVAPIYCRTTMPDRSVNNDGC